MNFLKKIYYLLLGIFLFIKENVFTKENKDRIKNLLKSFLQWLKRLTETGEGYHKDNIKTKPYFKDAKIFPEKIASAFPFTKSNSEKTIDDLKKEMESIQEEINKKQSHLANADQNKSDQAKKQSPFGLGTANLENEKEKDTLKFKKPPFDSFSNKKKDQEKKDQEKKDQGKF